MSACPRAPIAFEVGALAVHAKGLNRVVVGASFSGRILGIEETVTEMSLPRLGPDSIN